MNDRYWRQAKDIVSRLTEDEKLEMLSTHHGAVERLGLGEFYIGTEGRKLPFCQSRSYCLIIHQRASSCVDEDGGGAHLTQRIAINKVTSSVCKRTV